MAKTLDEAGVKRLIQEIKGANKNLNAPIPISTENTTESMAQNVKNIADYVEKAKAAGIASVNGMAVTCLIDGENSGVGYLYVYSANEINIHGVLIKDDLVDNMVFSILGGRYTERAVIVADNNKAEVTSNMLNEGARKPIILTPSTTEVDEETYQKLLSDDVDVIADFIGGGNFIEPQAKFNTGEALILIFGYSQFDENNQGVIATYTISINTSAPHTLNLAAIGACEPVPKDTLSPVLQEIDLTGTDADRKAKLDQFETDWEALTGASDLTGARFVGKFGITDDIERNVTGIMTYCAGDDTNKKNDNHFYGICNGYSFSRQKSQIAVKVSCKDGSLTITPLFSHLEAITIYTDNTPEHMQANLDNIAAYEANLQALGVDTTKSPMIPVCGADDGGYCGYMSKWGDAYMGYSNTDEVVTPAYFYINNEGLYKNYILTDWGSVETTFTNKSLNAKSLEAITIKTGNTPNDKAANVAAIKAYVDNLTALGVDTTKGYMIPVKLDNGYHGFIMGTDANGGHTGIIKRNTYNYGGGWIFIDKIGTYLYLECLTLGSYDNLTTTAKTIVPAINEVNAIAKGYSTIFTPIELTTETAQNKTAIDARMAAFTAQGISLTNGCCIPVTYKGVYAGNISLINGDWYGLLVKNTNNPADNINIKLSADGTITEGNSAQ